MTATLKRLWARLIAFAGGRALDRDFDDELASHLAMQIDENIARGMTPEQARRAAQIRVGGAQSLRQQHREARGLPALENVLRDVRLAFRLIGKEPAFSTAVIVVLALGIGINALGFTIVNAAFLRGLPFPDAGRIYMLSWLTRGGDTATVSHAELEDWRSQIRTFSALAAFTSDPVNISDDRTWPEEVRGARLTANAFAVLQQQPLFGRAFAPGDDRRGADPVAIIGYNLWRDRYGSDPDVLGKLVRVNGNAATIVGVMAERMSFPDNNDLWIPLIPTDAEAGRGWGSRPLGVFGRLEAGVGRAAAQAELNHVAQQLVAAHPEASKDLVGIEMETFTEHFVGGMARVMFLVVMGAVGFVLLIACANVANLLLSRSSYREREIALRMALGATRARVVWQLLLESVVLGVIGGGVGMLLAIAGARMFDAAVQDPGKPYWIVFTVDYVVLAYVSAICVLTAIVAGLAPALQLSRRTNHDVLKEGGRGSVGNRRVRWMSATMVVTELTLTVVLLTGAGLMIRSFIKLSASDIGFDTGGLMAMRMQLPVSKYATADARQAFFDRLGPRVASIAGVESMALTTSVPPFNSREQMLEIEGRPPDPDARPDYVATISVSPSFFDVLDLTLLRGRGLQETDGTPGNETAIVNEQLVRQYFADQDPIGTRIRFRERNTPAPSAWRTIVGVSPSLRHGPMVEVEMDPAVYMPYRQSPPTAVSLLLRSQLPPGSVMDAVRREVTAIDADQPVFTLQTLEQMVSESRWPLRVFGTLFAVFAAIALVLSSVGLYAVMAYSVTQRTQEIGVRMAVGAGRLQVSWLILKRGLFQLAIGLTLGLAGALALSRVIRGMLVEISPSDPITFAAITTLLTVVSILACLLPAQRAMRVDPVEALRAD
jgi:putative ABC transport system permease protein